MLNTIKYTQLNQHGVYRNVFFNNFNKKYKNFYLI